MENLKCSSFVLLSLEGTEGNGDVTFSVSLFHGESLFGSPFFHNLSLPAAQGFGSSLHDFSSGVINLM